MNPSMMMQQIMKLLESQSNNPMAQNLASMLKQNDIAGIESLARNLMESQGKDFDTEFSSFKQRLGLH